MAFTLLLIVSGQFSVLATFPERRECALWAQHLRVTYPDVKGQLFCFKQWRI